MSEKKCSPLAAAIFGFLLGAVAMKLIERFCPYCRRGGPETCCCEEGEGEGGCCGGDGAPCCCQEPEPEAGAEAAPAE